MKHNIVIPRFMRGIHCSICDNGGMDHPDKPGDDVSLVIIIPGEADGSQ